MAKMIGVKFHSLKKYKVGKVKSEWVPYQFYFLLHCQRNKQIFNMQIKAGPWWQALRAAEPEWGRVSTLHGLYMPRFPVFREGGSPVPLLLECESLGDSNSEKLACERCSWPFIMHFSLHFKVGTKIVFSFLQHLSLSWSHSSRKDLTLESCGKGSQLCSKGFHINKILEEVNTLQIAGCPAPQNPSPHLLNVPRVRSKQNLEQTVPASEFLIGASQNCSRACTTGLVGTWLSQPSPQPSPCPGRVWGLAGCSTQQHKPW